MRNGLPERQIIQKDIKNALQVKQPAGHNFYWIFSAAGHFCHSLTIRSSKAFFLVQTETVLACV